MTIIEEIIVTVNFSYLKLMINCCFIFGYKAAEGRFSDTGITDWDLIKHHVLYDGCGQFSKFNLFVRQKKTGIILLTNETTALLSKPDLKKLKIFLFH